MKRQVIVALLLTIAVMLLPRVLPAETAAKPQETALPAPALADDAKRTIKLKRGDEVMDINVFDYLTGVVAAEMPVSFEPEALKAQAVAARSYLERELSSPRHDDADICSDPACCQAYKSTDELKSSWGGNFEAYIEKIRSAVRDTDSEYLSYGGEPALAAFHSSSSDATEDSSAVWGSVPYLVSVATPEGAEDVPNFESRTELTDLDFRDTILHLKPEADMTGEADTWVRDIKRDASGRVASADIGGAEFTGAEIRALFSLRSTCFELVREGGKFIFTVRGYGHGVGMSQYGANVMAKGGADYREILNHYYPGTEIS